MSSRIKVTFPQGEPMPSNIFPDYDWLRENRSILSEKYGSCVVVIYEKQVLAVGATYSEALANAEENLPEAPEIITPVVEFVGYNSFRLHVVRHNHAEGEA